MFGAAMPPTSPEMCNRRTKASIEMFDEPMDDSLWQLVALGAGTGAAASVNALHKGFRGDMRRYL